MVTTAFDWRRLGADMVGTMICDAWYETDDGEVAVEIEFEADQPERVLGCWRKDNGEEVLLDTLDSDQYLQLGGWARDHIADLADWLEAMDEDRPRHSFGKGIKPLRTK